MKKLCALLMMITLIALSGCSVPESNAEAITTKTTANTTSTETAKKKNVDTSDDPLTVQFVPTNNDGSMQAKAKPFAAYLTEKLDRPVKVTLATDYSTIVEAMASGQVDIGIMPPAAFAQARDMGAAEGILSSQLGEFDQKTGLPVEGVLTGTFKGEILVKANSSIHSLQDLKGKKIGTLSPNSASGYIYPVAEMKTVGIDPTTECTLTTVNDIPSLMTSVLNGQQDACFVFEGARVVFGFAFENNDLMSELRVLYLSKGDIPNDAIAVQPELTQDLKDKIKSVFLAMPDDKVGAEVMSMWGHKRYGDIDNTAYDTIRDYTDKASE